MLRLCVGELQNGLRSDEYPSGSYLVDQRLPILHSARVDFARATPDLYRNARRPTLTTAPIFIRPCTSDKDLA
jgi:hypothetical protein